MLGGCCTFLLLDYLITERCTAQQLESQPVFSSVTVMDAEVVELAQRLLRKLSQCV
jgi:hypothetical protein